MNTTTRDLTIAYIENALAEVALLHDEKLIEPTLEKFHIECHHVRFHGLAPKQSRFMFKPRPVYTVTDGNGTPLGESIHEGDLGTRYAEHVIEQQIAANLEAMLTDHADLVTLHRAGDGGAAPSLRYRPASSLGERTDTEAALERQKMILRTEIEQLREQHETGQAQNRATLRKGQETENALEDAKRTLNRVRTEQQNAQKTIDRAARIRHLDAIKQGEVPSPWDDTPGRNDGPEFG